MDLGYVGGWVGRCAVEVADVKLWIMRHDGCTYMRLDIDMYTVEHKIRSS